MKETQNQTRITDEEAVQVIRKIQETYRELRRLVAAGIIEWCVVSPMSPIESERTIRRRNRTKRAPSEGLYHSHIQHYNRETRKTYSYRAYVRKAYRAKVRKQKPKRRK